MDNNNFGGSKDWNDLSYEILVIILMSLNVADLAAVSLVCKTWNEACRDSSLWRTLDLSRHSSYCINLPNRLGAYKRKRSSRKMTQFLMYVLSLSNGNTTCIVFNYYVYLTDQMLINAAARTPNLKRLVLPKTGEFSREGLNLAMRSWRGLESITLTSVVPGHLIFPAIRKYCKNIVEMKYSCGCMLTEKHAEAMIKYTPKLKVLSIQSIPASVKPLCSLVTLLKHLEVVNICHTILVDESTDVNDNFDIRDLQNLLPPSSFGKLIHCQGGWCLRCKNFWQDTDLSKQPHRVWENTWREDEIPSLSH